jgi:uncharacterized protein (TIGR02118 family)
MAAFVALWPKPEDVEGFEKRYRETHVPILEEYPGARSVRTIRATGTPRGDDAPFHIVTIVEFDSADDLKGALRSEPGSRSADDAREIASEHGIAPVLLVGADL